MTPKTERLQQEQAFTLIELLVVIAIIAILAAILFPVFSRAKLKAKQTVDMSHMKQIGLSFFMYLSDYDDRMPDRRDLKTSLPGGWKPWTTWPRSDPRAGWAVEVFRIYSKNDDIWISGGALGLYGRRPEVYQQTTTDPEGPASNYWMWRFDRPDDPIPLDNFWGKTPDQAVLDLQAANNPFIGVPDGVSDVELMVNPYFPKTIPSVPEELKGKSVYFGGRNRMFLDTHVKFLKDRRTD